MASQRERVEIRRLRAADAKDYRAVLIEALIVHPDCFFSHYNEELSRSLQDSEQALEQSGTFGAWVGTVLAGIGSEVPCSELKRSHCGRVRNLYVRDRFRRKGVGGQLLKQILEFASNGVERLEVEVPSTCENVVRLFEQFGFRLCGLAPNSLGIGSQRTDVWTMDRPLR